MIEGRRVGWVRVRVRDRVRVRVRDRVRVRVRVRVRTKHTVERNYDQVFFFIGKVAEPKNLQKKILDSLPALTYFLYFLLDCFISSSNTNITIPPYRVDDRLSFGCR